MLTSAAVRAESAPPATPEPNRPGRPSDPLSFVEGSADDWSVLDGEKGCYLLSAYRKGSSRLAMGRHPVLGTGLFLVGLGLSLSQMGAAEAVVIQDGRGSPVRQGRVVANMLLFVPLDTSELDGILSELETAGVLWIAVRRTFIAHGGGRVGPAAVEFRHACWTTRGHAVPAHDLHPG